MVGLFVYLLCTLTSAGCAWLLWRGYRRSQQRLLYWSALCFAILAVSNAVLILDLVVFPDVYLLTTRTLITQAGLLVLIYGMIFESD